VLKALKIDVEESKTVYNADFIAKMQEGEEDIKAGRTVKMTLDELWKWNSPGAHLRNGKNGGRQIVKANKP